MFCTKFSKLKNKAEVLVPSAVRDDDFPFFIIPCCFMPSYKMRLVAHSVLRTSRCNSLLSLPYCDVQAQWAIAGLIIWSTSAMKQQINAVALPTSWPDSTETQVYLSSEHRLLMRRGGRCTTEKASLLSLGAAMPCWQQRFPWASAGQVRGPVPLSQVR